jgi:hypothetical protein
VLHPLGTDRVEMVVTAHGPAVGVVLRDLGAESPLEQVTGLALRTRAASRAPTARHYRHVLRRTDTPEQIDQELCWPRRGQPDVPRDNEQDDRTCIALLTEG